MLNCTDRLLSVPTYLNFLILKIMNALADQISKFQADFLPNVPAEILATMKEATQKLADTDITTRALKTGDQFPEFTLPNEQGRDTAITSLLGQKPFVFTVYRGGWCPYCNLQLKHYEAHLSQIKDLGAELLAMTPELPDASLNTSEINDLSFTILSDAGNKIAKNMGITFDLAEALRPIYHNFGIDVPAHNGDQSYTLPMAVTYVVDASGKIVWDFVDSDYTKRAEMSDILEVLKGL